MTLGERLVRLRNQAGMSQDALAEKLGVSRQSVSKWETDASVPDLDKLVKLSEIFDRSLDELVKGEAPTSAAPQTTGISALRRKLTALYREKAYLLGWLLVGWGVHRLILAVQSYTAYYKKWGWKVPLNF